jgi:5S rRNA maturation endonuclease (ribonuclease M5)/transposase-like protein
MIEDLFHDFGVDTAPEGHKHSRPGWVNVECPFCSGEHEGYHLGYNIDEKYFYCWRCGRENTYSITNTIAKIIGVDKKFASKLAKQYDIYSKKRRKTNHVVTVNRKPHKLPTDTRDMTKRHKRYIEKRGFDPDLIEQQYGVLGTGPASVLDNISYKHRILIPIYYKGEQVSFQARDITGKSQKRYLACPKVREKIDHKHTLYGYDQCKSDTAIVVEGFFDAWRFPRYAVATYGIEYTREQLILLSQFNRVITIFDPDEKGKQSQKQAKKLRKELTFRGVKCDNVILNADPADTPQEEADYLLKQLIFNRL